jgi:hypothetical protein
MTSHPRSVPRWRMVAFWVVMVVLVFLHLGERPEILAWVVTAFGADHHGHEIHFFTLSLLTWSVVAGVAVNVRHTHRQVGAAWVYSLTSVLAFAMFLALADVPPEMVPVLAAVTVVGLVAFLTHPSRLRDKFRPTARPSVALLGLLVIAAAPLMGYAMGQLQIHAASGPGDEHYEFGHWLVMAIYAFTVVAVGLVAAVKVAGWRTPAWVTGALVAGLGIGSLGITAVSQLSAPWAMAAIAWGIAFVVVAELEARATPVAPEPRPVTVGTAVTPRSGNRRGRVPLRGGR